MVVVVVVVPVVVLEVVPVVVVSVVVPVVVPVVVHVVVHVVVPFNSTPLNLPATPPNAYVLLWWLLKMLVLAPFSAPELPAQAGNSRVTPRNC